MAQKHRNEVIVGLTVLLVLALTVYVVVVLADWSNLFQKKQNLTVRLPYKMGLKGLTIGSPVFLGGAKIGQITDTGIETDESINKIFVFFTMQLPAQYQLRRDCLLSAQSNVLGGQASLAIKDLGSQKTLITEGEPVILQLEGTIADTMDAVRREFDAANPDSLMYSLKYELNRKNPDAFITSLAQAAENLRLITQKIDLQLTPDDEKQSLISKVQAVLESLRSITESINNQLDQQDKNAVLAKLHAALDALSGSLNQIEDLVKTNKPVVTDTVASLQKTAKNLQENLPAITEQLKQSLAKADKSLDTASAALVNLKDAAAAARETLLVNRESIDRIIANLTEVSTNFKMTSRQIRRAPWLLIYKPKKGELNLQGLIDAAGGFAAGAERLDETTLRLQNLLETTGDMIPLKKDNIEAMIADLEASFDQFKKAEEKFWKEVK